MLATRALRGDTIIEVLLAITIFSMVSVGAMTVMNQGTNAAQRSLEITLVRQQIDAQAEALRAAQQAYSTSADPANSVWAQITAGSDTTVWNNDGACPGSPADVNGAFILDGRSATVIGGTWLASINNTAAPPHAQVFYDEDPAVSYGMWIERARRTPQNASIPEAYDFNVRACWYSAGLGSTPMQIETLVRLYDPS